MMEPAKNRMRNNVSEPLNRTCAGRVLPEWNVSSHFIIIGGVFRKNSPKVLGVEHNQMIRALASDTAALGVRDGSIGLFSEDSARREPAAVASENSIRLGW